MRAVNSLHVSCGVLVVHSGSRILWETPLVARLAQLVGITLDVIDKELEDWSEARSRLERRLLRFGLERRLDAAAGDLARLLDEPHLEHPGKVAVGRFYAVMRVTISH